MDDLLKIQYKTNIEILIQPISSLYDLLPNRETNNYLKELYNNYSEYIEKSKSGEKDIYKIKDIKYYKTGIENEYKINILNEINNLKFNKFIHNNEGFEINYIILPFDQEILKMSYNDIDINRLINYEYDKDNIIDSIITSIESNIRKIQYEKSNLQYIKVIYSVPLYDNNELEFRYQKKSSTKPMYYKDIFNVKNFERIKNLPMTTNLQIKENIKESIEMLFLKLKKNSKDKIKPDIEFIKFFETLYKYSRNKKLRDDIIYKSKFYKVIILYSTDFLDKDITKLNNEYYYELPSVFIKKEYIDSIDSTEIKEYLKAEQKYIDNKYKINDSKDYRYRCIGKINKVGYNKYKFTVMLKQLLFDDIYKVYDTISIYMYVDSNMFGLFHTYKIEYKDDKDDNDDNNDNNDDEKIYNKYLDIENKKGTLKIFNENDIKLLKYNNIDKMSGDNNELYISKSYKIDNTSFKNYLKKDVTSIDILNYLKSPTELKKYEIFIEQNYPKLKYKKKKLENKLVSNKEYYKSFLNILFKENTLFHLKPRDNTIISNTQYKIKMDNNLSIYEFNNKTDKDPYNSALKTLFKKEIKHKYVNIIKNIKPDYLIYVNLLLQKNNYIKKKYNYDCKEIKYKIIKHTKRLFSGGTIKLKTKNNNKCNKYIRTCRLKQFYRRYSRRKV